MSVRKIRNSWWVDFRHEGVRLRKRSPENSRRGAEAYEALLRWRAARGEPFSNGTNRRVLPTFGEFAKEWMATWVRSNNKASTIGNKASALRANLVPNFGDLRLDEITNQRIEQFKASRAEQGCAAQTINNDLAILRGCLRTAVEWSLLDKLPQVRWLRAPRAPVTFLSPEEAERLIEAADPPRWREMMIVALHTGLRYGELAALDWSDLDLVARRLTVRRNYVEGVFGTPKNHRERHVPLTRRVVETLGSRTHKRGLVFAEPDGRPIKREKAGRALRRACLRAGLEPLGWHRLRHSFASHLVARGVPLPAIQQLLGHATITMTMRYAHLAPNALTQAVAVLDSEPGPEGSGHSVGNGLCAPAVVREAVLAA